MKSINMHRPHWASVGGRLLLVAGAYGLSAALDITAPGEHGLVFFRLAPGVSLIAVLLLGFGTLPGVFAGAVTAHMLTSQPLDIATVSAVAETSFAALGAYVTRRFHGTGYLLSNVRSVLVLALGVSLFSAAAAAAMGAGGMLAAGALGPGEFWDAWRLWWLGDFAATLVVAPLLAAWVRPLGNRDFRLFAETALLAASSYAAGLIAFHELLGKETSGLLPALALIPFLSWGALRFDHRTSTTAVWIIALTAASGMAGGMGPFAGAGLHEAAISLHTYIGIVAAASALSLGAAAQLRSALKECPAAGPNEESGIRWRSREAGEPDTMARRQATRGRREEGLPREGEQRFRNAFSLAPIGMAIVSPRRQYLKVNQAYCDISGYGKLELLSMKAGTIAHPDDQPMIVRLMERMIHDEVEHFDADIRLIHKSGRVIWAHYNASMVRDENGEPAYAVITVQDVTKKTLAEQELREGRQRYQTLVETIPYGIQETDVNGVVVFANKALHEMLGYREGEMLGLPIVHFLPRSEHEAFARRFANLPRERPSTARLYKKNISKSGTLIDVQVSWNHKLNDTGEVVGFISVITDITEQKEIEKQLRRYHADLEQRVEARTCELTAAITELESFSYSISHDLRTPLRAINGFSRALAEDYDHCFDDNGRDYIRRICGATVHMGNLIDGLLNLSRVIRRDLKLATVSLSDIAGSVSQALRQREPESNTLFKIQKGLTAIGDATLIHVLVDNLLENAWKFTRKSKQAVIEFGVAQIEGQDTFFVRDNGIGFEMQYIHKLFQPFERLHTLSDYEGTGIGLATVRRIVQRHGGSTWAEGSPDRGATFYFTLGKPGLKKITGTSPAVITP